MEVSESYEGVPCTRSTRAVCVWKGCLGVVNGSTQTDLGHGSRCCVISFAPCTTVSLGREASRVDDEACIILCSLFAMSCPEEKARSLQSAVSSGLDLWLEHHQGLG